MERLFSNKKVSKAKKDVKGYSCGGSCVSACGYGCGTDCSGGCYTGCGFSCAPGCGNGCSNHVL